MHIEPGVGRQNHNPPIPHEHYPMNMRGGKGPADGVLMLGENQPSHASLQRSTKVGSVYNDACTKSPRWAVTHTHPAPLLPHSGTHTNRTPLPPPHMQGGKGVAADGVWTPCENQPSHASVQAAASVASAHPYVQVSPMSTPPPTPKRARRDMGGGGADVGSPGQSAVGTRCIARRGTGQRYPPSCAPMSTNTPPCL
jgi:hypothetical protein